MLYLKLSVQQYDKHLCVLTERIVMRMCSTHVQTAGMMTRGVLRVQYMKTWSNRDTHGALCHAGCTHPRQTQKHRLHPHAPFVTSAALSSLDSCHSAAASPRGHCTGGGGARGGASGITDTAAAAGYGHGGQLPQVSCTPPVTRHHCCRRLPTAACCTSVLAHQQRHRSVPRHIRATRCLVLSRTPVVHTSCVRSARLCSHQRRGLCCAGSEWATCGSAFVTTWLQRAPSPLPPTPRRFSCTLAQRARVQRRWRIGRRRCATL
jgi:hypothetical protein